MTRQTRSHKHSGNSFGGSLTRALFVAFLMAMIILPLTGNMAGAEDNVVINPVVLGDQPLVVDPSVINPPIVDPDPVTPEPTLVVNQIPNIDVVQNLTPAIFDPSIYPSDLYINPILCPADLDLWSVDYYGLALNCQGGFADGYELHVQTQSAPVWQQVIQGGGVSITGIAQDTYAIAFTHPQGGGSNLRIICSADDTLGNDAIPFADLTVDQFGGDLFIQGNLMYWCDAFIQQDGPFVPSAEDMTVYINKHGCPEGIVSDNEYFLASICHDELTGIDFSLTDNNGVTTQTTAGSPAMATFNGVDGSSIALAETIPAGFNNPAVFCDVEDALGNDLLSQILQPTVTQGAWTIDNIPADAGMIFCDVFNFPTDSDGGSIIVIKYECPADFDFTTGDPLADCGALLNGVQFNTTSLGGYAAQTNTGDSINGAVMFGGLQADEYSVVETLPANMTQAWWWSCSSDTVDLSGFVPEDHSDGSGFVYSLADNEDLVCRVYNAPSNDGHVTVHKWECPEAYDASHDFAWYQTNCTTPMEDVHFYVLNNNDSTTVDYFTDANGDLSFTYDMGENLTMYEEVPSGYSDPVFLCKWGGYADDGFGGFLAIDGMIQALDTPTNRADLPGDYNDFGMDCNFYNNPTDGQSVTVYKYTCPADYDLSNPQADCTQLTDDVDFHLLPEGGSQLDATTGSAGNGAVYFGDVPSGNTKLWETVPAGTINTYVTCQWFDNNGPYVYQQFPVLAVWDGAPIGNAIDFSIAQGDEVVCQWYNVPTKTWSGGDLTIYKYWCANNIVSDATCELGSGVKFIVTKTDGSLSPILTQTGPGGFVDVVGLPAGAYAVNEKDYTWCKAVASKVDSDGNIVIEDGQETILTVYNCTDTTTKKDPTPVVVTKFPNTGAGAAVGQGSDDDMILLISALLVALGAMGIGLMVHGTRRAAVAIRIEE